MPRRQPFTRLCQLAASLANPSRADLHVHSTASDGDFTPSQVVAFAERAGLTAVALTDHDTLGGHAEARDAIRANRFKVELVTGIEISTFHGDRDLHLLAYDFQVTDAIRDLIRDLQAARRTRFVQFGELLAGQGTSVPRESMERLMNQPVSLGRRHLASLLVETGIVARRFDAFRRFLSPLARQVEPLRTIAFEDVISVVLAAGGFTSLAHPSDNVGIDELAELRDCGLDAVEVAFPAAALSRTRILRDWAGALGLGTTGGSDSHGPDRAIGGRTIPMNELDHLRRKAGSGGRSEMIDGARDARSRD